jgi:hypothetical protein
VASNVTLPPEGLVESDGGLAESFTHLSLGFVCLPILCENLSREVRKSARPLRRGTRADSGYAPTCRVSSHRRITG